MDKLTTLSLTESEVELFKEFCKHREAIDAMRACKAWDVRNGKAILHFDNYGLRQITFDIIGWKSENVAILHRNSLKKGEN